MDARIHMIGNISYFDSLNEIDKGNVTFGNNEKDKIWGRDTIKNSFLSIDEVLYVDI